MKMPCKYYARSRGMDRCVTRCCFISPWNEMHNQTKRFSENGRSRSDLTASSHDCSHYLSCDRRRARSGGTLLIQNSCQMTENLIEPCQLLSVCLAKKPQ